MRPVHARRTGRTLSRLAGAGLAPGLLLSLFACSQVSPPPPVTVEPGALGSFSVEVRVAASIDDAEEKATGQTNRSSTDLELVQETTTQTVGMRFAGIPVPQGVVINNAYIQFTVDEATSGDTTLLIQGQASDDAASFRGTSLNISSRPRTSAGVAWTPAPWEGVGTAGTDQATPDLKDVLQEIVDRPGWQSGNALVLIITGSGKRVAEAYDGNPAAAPLLHIEYGHDDSVSIASFTATPDATERDQLVTFAWSVSDADGDPVGCTLDVDGDGATDYDLSDCLATTSQTHAYSTLGTFQAVLTATDTTGVAATATASVTVTTSDSVVLAAAGDIACDPDNAKFNGGNGTVDYCHMKATSDLLLAMDPDAVLVLGDNQYEEGTLDQFLRSYDLSWGRLKDITFPVAGNHEYITAGAAGYFTYFGSVAGDPTKGYYSFDLGVWHIVTLNSNCSKAGGCRAGSPQEKWLRADLAAHPSQCTLAMWHHPRFSSGAIGGRDWTIDLWRALQDAGAELVLVGHDHNYERFAPQDADGIADPNGLREFVVGTGGKNHTSIYTLQPNSEVRHSGTYGVLKLTLHPTSYEWEFVPEPGQSFTDAGSDVCR